MPTKKTRLGIVLAVPALVFVFGGFSAASAQREGGRAASSAWFTGDDLLYTYAERTADDRTANESSAATLVVRPSSEESQVRIYLGVPLTQDEVGVRYAFGTTAIAEDAPANAWATVVGEDGERYAEVPEELTSSLLSEAREAGSVTLEFSSGGAYTVRTFSFGGYAPAYAKLRETYVGLGLPGDDGSYIVMFTVRPVSATVDVFRRGRFRVMRGGYELIKEAEGRGPWFALELPAGRYQYVGKAPGYLEQVHTFSVPATTEVAVEAQTPTGFLKLLTDRGYTTPKVYGADWPLNVQPVLLGCEPHRRATAQTIRGKFALNRGAQYDYPSIEPLVKVAAGQKMAIGGLVERALTLCD